MILNISFDSFSALHYDQPHHQMNGALFALPPWALINYPWAVVMAGLRQSWP